MSELSADCASCAGLCCVALPFSRSSDFAFDKAGGEPCRNLLTDFSCGVHSTLRERGMPGCTVFDCMGSGQKVTQVTFGGLDWRSSPDIAPAMFEVFPIMTQLHELLWYLQDSLRRERAGGIRRQLSDMYDATELLTSGGPSELAALDVATHRSRVDELLTEVSRLVRGNGKNLRGADLVGASRKGGDFRRTNLRGALLIGADLRSADLREADVIGADFRGARLQGADLSTALFLTRGQINSAVVDETTRLPGWHLE